MTGTGQAHAGKPDQNFIERDKRLYREFTGRNQNKGEINYGII